jgi:tetratricopeptide (TPR) repeat protein
VALSLAKAIVLAALLAPSPSEDALARLIARLGSENWHEREAAAEEILRLGPAAAEPLAQALKHPDPEVRSRARLLLDQLRWRPPSGLPPALAAALENFADLPDDRRASLLAQVANAAGDRSVPFLRQTLRNDRSLDVRKAALDRLARLDPRAAEADLRAFAAEKPPQTWVHAALGDLLARAGRFDDAIAAYEAARQADWTNSDILLPLASLYERKGDWRKAVPIYTALIPARPTEPRYRVQLGWCHFRLGEQAQAEAAWRDIPFHYGHSREAYLLLASTYQQAGNPEKAIAALRAGIERHEKDFELSRRLAATLLDAGRADEAIAAFRQAADLATTQYQQQSITQELGRALRATGQIDAYVQREETELAKLDAQIVQLTEALVQRALADGDTPKARTLLERLTTLYPSTPAAARAAQRLKDLK